MPRSYIWPSKGQSWQHWSPRAFKGPLKRPGSLLSSYHEPRMQILRPLLTPKVLHADRPSARDELKAIVVREVVVVEVVVVVLLILLLPKALSLSFWKTVEVKEVGPKHAPMPHDDGQRSLFSIEAATRPSSLRGVTEGSQDQWMNVDRRHHIVRRRLPRFARTYLMIVWR